MNSYWSKYRAARVVVVVFIAILVFGGCKNKVNSPVVAKVGNRTLTLDDLYESIPPEYSDRISKEQHINYVKQWIDIELLYQEALRRKIDNEKIIKERLERMKKDLLSAEIISRSSMKIQAEGVTEEAVSDYYNKHKSEFVRDKDLVKFLEIVVSDAQTASEVKRISTNDNFESLIARYSSEPVPSEVPYVAVDEIDPKIAQLITGSSTSAIRGPVKTEAGYHVILVMDVQEAGELCKEEEVREEITNILSAQLQKVEMEKALADLRMKTDVRVNFDVIPGKIRTDESGNSQKEKPPIVNEGE